MADIITTVTKDINEITKIKNDLNALLRENGIEGGPVFSTYPDKFRSLFRVLDGRTEESTWNLPADSVSVITSVPKPVIVRRENSNTFYLYCANPDASIYYTIDSEHYHIGERLYTAHGLLTITEDSYITAYAKVREVRSELSWWNVEHLAEDTPESPEFDRDGTTLTITCSTEDAIIWYRVGEVGEFSQYTEPLTNVPRTSNVYAYSSNLSHQSSEIVVDEAPEQIEIPHTPSISQDINEIIVTSDEDDVTLYWKKTTDRDWTEYSEGDEITESGYYISMAIRDGVMSEWSTPVELTFYPTPAVPTYQQNINTVALQCSTSGAVIYYSFDDGETWNEYKGTFEIDEDETMILKSVLGPVESDESSPIELTYIPKPATPVITCSENIVTIACSTTGASIYFKINQEPNWRAYIVPFEITTTTFIEAIARKDERDSDMASKLCDFELVTRPATPIINCSNNEVTLYTPTSGATMYYRVYGTSSWIEYTGPFNIYQTDYYEAKSTKNGVDSYISSPFLCQYVSNPPARPKPAEPVITLYNNVVTIISPTEGATILWTEPNSTSWNVYTTPFAITRDITIVAKCTNAYGESKQVYKDCKYTPTIPVPVISCDENVVEISDSMDGVTIWYRDVNTVTWIEYTGPFYIEETITIESKATYNEFESEISDPYTCTFDTSVDPEWAYYRRQYFTVENLSDKDGNILIYKKLNIEASKDNGQTWLTDFEIYPSTDAANSLIYNNYVYIPIGAKEKVLLRGVNIHYKNSGYNGYFSRSNYTGYEPAMLFLNFNASIYGNVASLSAGYNYLNEIGTSAFLCNMLSSNTNLKDAKYMVLPWRIVTQYDYYGLFYNCSNLENIPKWLPSKDLWNHAYEAMFFGCKSIPSIPDDYLSSAKLGISCYESMFEGCKGLSTVPESLLPSTALNQHCYKRMFAGCTGLTSIPENLLQCTSLSYGCYTEMFLGCSKLKTLPEGLLPATTLASACYRGMFSYCNGLTTLPEGLLPATTLAEYCYYRMFEKCGELTNTPNLVASTLAKYSYVEMFHDSMKLNYIKCLAENNRWGSSSGNNLQGWIPTNYFLKQHPGTFVQKAGVSWTYSYGTTTINYIPEGWTVIEV